jgi:hypothetical protein
MGKGCDWRARRTATKRLSLITSAMHRFRSNEPVEALLSMLICRQVVMRSTPRRSLSTVPSLVPELSCRVSAFNLMMKGMTGLLASKPAALTISGRMLEQQRALADFKLKCQGQIHHAPQGGPGVEVVVGEKGGTKKKQEGRAHFIKRGVPLVVVD